ncbi:hypothetical protein PoB_006693700 [Plakobranchus ocellatus]|uniref:Uncharacterized protein n=1 Tax=Plakobranchus ocellatus TaxID=259542 RepID=A0AAV4D8L2_9GAST|nr:hypothetical protein PoB_006693700 [Plakobranchus ocellatus]
MDCVMEGRRQRLEEKVVEWEDREEDFKPCGQNKTFIRDVNLGLCLQIQADLRFFQDCPSAKHFCQSNVLTYWTAEFHKNLLAQPECVMPSDTGEGHLLSSTFSSVLKIRSPPEVEKVCGGHICAW